MAKTIPQLTELFKRELEMCDVTPDETVLVVSQAESREPYIEAFKNAAEVIGSTVSHLELPGLKHPMFPYGGSPDSMPLSDVDEHIQNDPAARGALENSDFVVDLTAEGLIHTKARTLTLENGARMISCWEPASILEQMFPREDLRERVETAEQMVIDADEMRVTSKAGTDVTVEVGQDPPTVPQYGYTDEPGRWDHFVSGFIAFYPVDGSQNGKIVLDAGDVILPLRRYVDNPIEFTLEDGFITDIDGDGADCALIESYLEMWDDEDAYAASHFGWGMDETASWENIAAYATTGVDARGTNNRSQIGNFMWSTGPNRFVGRDTRAHLDFPMRNCTVSLDGEVVVEDGDVVDSRLTPNR
ncbi:hypothetical protein [Natrarchaeobius oligotrophus]|uniref:Leucyl aminopeptidase n=1 Tax=Natrarchaeobius chitinivorans TaxID=1679083 RepID=A0A3N6MWS1_NATCH|nr:hypothetical protein [Natrarchaeobius chitinivorans]RQG99436.1 hypothetical protein EA472_14520 [Natrarchaeobius chitinivorans]